MPKPNILLILSDDQPRHTIRRQRAVLSYLVAGGTNLFRGYATISLCGPCRATIYSGMYPHNHQVLTNQSHFPFRTNLGGTLDSNSLAVRMKAAGYTTGLFGKYMNNHENDLPERVPPGWDRWREILAAGGLATEPYQVNTQGVLSFVDRAVVNENAWPTIRLKGWLDIVAPAAASGTTPFFAVYAPTAPHKPYTPSSKHEFAYDAAMPREVESVNETNEGKPAHMQGLARVSWQERQDEYEGKLEELRDLDDQLTELFEHMKLREVWNNTVVIYTSDNGFHLGEHRLMKKSSPYEEAVRAPFVFRGPGIMAGTTRGALVGSVDIPKTVLGWAKGDSSGMDGMDLRPILSGDKDHVRRDLLCESPDEGWALLRRVDGRRDWSYIRYKTGERELYDLAKDRHQMTNLIPSTDSRLLADLATNLAQLETCAGANCG